jgi:hypothetical protein
LSLLPFPASFAKHDCARRKFRIRIYDPTLDEIVVEVIESWRVRFRCRHCLKTFTEYPPFALPHKRFVKQEVLAKALKYLSAEKKPKPKCRATYREAVWEGRGPLSYAEDQEGRQVSHSTVWRWLSWLGSRNDLREQATQLIFQKDPQANLHWKPHPIAKHKVRSERRRKTLEQAAMMLDVVETFSLLFGVSLFTHLGTCGAVR